VEDLGQVRADHDDRHAALREVIDQAVDVGLGADVDAAGRFVEDQEAGVRVEPFAQHDLLLVAA
jgi:hypothetical protein